MVVVLGIAATVEVVVNRYVSSTRVMDNKGINTSETYPTYMDELF